MENYRAIIHLEWKGEREQKHEYYGSPASLYRRYSVTELGVGISALNTHFHRASKKGMPQVYETETCIIRKGVLVSSKPEDKEKSPSKTHE